MRVNCINAKVSVVVVVVVIVVDLFVSHKNMVKLDVAPDFLLIFNIIIIILYYK